MVIVDDNFWPGDISDELKNATITRPLVVSDDGDKEDVTTYNITCKDNDNRLINAFDYHNWSGSPNTYMISETGRYYVLWCV